MADASAVRTARAVRRAIGLARGRDTLTRNSHVARVARAPPALARAVAAAVGRAEGGRRREVGGADGDERRSACQLDRRLCGRQSRRGRRQRVWPRRHRRETDAIARRARKAWLADAAA
eukprot:6410828-Prymnesium_polylepis.1